MQITQRVFGMPVTVGLTDLRALTVSEAALRITGDAAEITLSGAMTCASGDGALLSGDAGVALFARGTVDLAGCVPGEVEILAESFSGSLGEVLEAAWEPILRPLLQDEAKGWLADACRDLTAP